MVNGLYTSAGSMMHLLKKQEVTSNNLANINTTGFKMAKLLTRTSVKIDRNDEAKLHQDEDQKLNEVNTSFAPGPLVQTGNSLDVAITSDGFFQIGTSEGIRFTRNGSFSLNAQGDLVTLSGDYVLERSGNRINPGEGTLTIMADGGLFVDNSPIGNLNIVKFQNKEYLRAKGNGYFENMDNGRNTPAEDLDPRIKQGYLEGSNVSMISSMVEMISQFRNYEASQKALQALDETIKKAVNEVGRVG